MNPSCVLMTPFVGGPRKPQLTAAEEETMGEMERWMDRGREGGRVGQRHEQTGGWMEGGRERGEMERWMDGWADKEGGGREG